jgi:hypothetical protein
MKGNGMNIALWVVAGLLAALFAASGAAKLAKTKEQLVASGQAALGDFRPGAVKAVGTLELLGAAGLILPAAFGTAPVLAAFAALGLALLMAGAAVVHSRRGEAKGVAVSAFLLVAAAVVAWGRFGPYAF